MPMTSGARASGPLTGGVSPAVTAGETPLVTAADARAPLVIGMAAWRSLREGRPVRIEEVDPA